VNYSVPKTTFAIEADRLRVGLETPCLRCGDRFRVGLAAWAMRVGKEVIGYLCDDCLTPAARERLRETAGKASR
jgi:hypothetical protein